MPDVKVYIRKEDFELWKQLENKSQAVSDMLNSTKSKVAKVRGVRTVPTGGTLVKKEANPDITAVIAYWLENTPFKIASKDMAMNRNNVSTLLKKYTLKDIETLIRTTMAAHADQYASKEQKAKSLIELQMNANAVVSYGMMKQQEHNNQGGIVI